MRGVVKDSTQPSAVHRLEPAIWKLSQALEILLNLKKDSRLASQSVPMFVELLASENSKENNTKACFLLHRMARQHASRIGLAKHPELLGAIVQLLHTSRDATVQSEAALSLQYLCLAKQASSAVRQFLPTPVLVKLLSHPTEVIAMTALSILHQLLLCQPLEARDEVRSCGGTKQLVILLSADSITDAKWLSVCIDAIRMTAFECHETKLMLAETTDLPDRIVCLLKSGNTVKLMYSLARLIKVLSVSVEGKTALVKAGVIQGLTRLLESGNETLVLETLWGLRNLSDQAFHLTDIARTLELLVPLLSSPLDHVAICSAGCLCNLTCKNSLNKATLIKLGGVIALCQCLMNYSTLDEVIEPVSSALRHLTHRNPHAKLAITQVQMFGVLPLLADKLVKKEVSATTLPTIKALLGLIHNLALESECRSQMHRLGLTTGLLSVLRALVGSAQSLLKLETGLRLEEMVELSLATLHIFSRQTESRDTIIYSPNFFTLALRFLYDDCEAIQRSVLGLLNELAQSHEGSVAIQREGCIPRITELVNSSNQAIATYSASLLLEVNHDRHPEYRRRLSRELHLSLYDGGFLDSPNGATDLKPATRDSALGRSPPIQDSILLVSPKHRAKPIEAKSLTSSKDKFSSNAGSAGLPFK